MTNWDNDKLDYEAIGKTFTNLIKTIDASKVISIEAGFGRGKTFFREAWSHDLRASGEIVVEIDVQQSDHSGDPVVTLLAALVDALPKDDKTKAKQALDSAKKLGAIGAKAATKLVFRAGADELIDVVTNTAIDKLDDFDALDGIVSEIGDGMSKAAGQLIAAQMAAEKVRQKELPEQLEALHKALTDQGGQDRVIIIIDELDRCHPDYAISVLETMKLIFNKSGFVFCLMVNAEYLENLAQHRFGTSTEDEKYLDKFVDIRLALNPSKKNLENAVIELTNQLPLAIPFGNTEDFSLNHAAQLAGTLAILSGLSLRQIKRILLKVEIAMRCYADRPIDASLLIYLAFRQEAKGKFGEDMLDRSHLTPQFAKDILATRDIVKHHFQDKDERFMRAVRAGLEKVGSSLNAIPADRFERPNINEDQWKRTYDWVKVIKYLAPIYIPSHENYLNAVANITAPDR